jgi:hypothetical protein
VGSKTLTGEINYGADVDWFAVKAADDLKITAALTGNAGISLQLYDAKFQELTSLSDVSLGKDAALYLKVSYAETFTSRISYSIALAAVYQDDHANESSGATPQNLAAGASYLTGTVNYSGDADWFVLNTLSNVSVRVTCPDSQIQMDLYDTQLNAAVKAPSNTAWVPANGKLYVKVSKTGTFTERLPYTISLQTFADNEPNVNTQNVTVQSYVNDQTITMNGSIAFTGDIDFFAVKSTINKSVKLEFACADTNVSYAVYQSNMQPATLTNGKLDMVANQTYYIRVIHQNGGAVSTAIPYTVTVKKAGFERSGNITASVTQNGIYQFALKGQGVESFAGEQITIKYDAARLELLDFAAQTTAANLNAGAVAETDLQIVSHTISGANSQIVFKSNKTIASGKEWSGMITLLSFKAKSTGGTTVSIQ